MFFVSVVSKGFIKFIRCLESTLTNTLISVASKGLECGRLRLKTGKTRCFFASADSKRLKEIAEKQGKAAGGISELGDGEG